MDLTVPVSVLPHGSELPLPSYATDGAAGMDLLAAIEREQYIEPGETAVIPTGIAIALPVGYEGQVRPRSGLALEYSIGIINSPGTIDSDYRGEIKVLLTNFSRTRFRINRGDRIAQLVVSSHERVEWLAQSTLPSSNRGEGGFGHTGVKA